MGNAVPQAAAIWMILLLLGAILVIAMSLPKPARREVVAEPVDLGERDRLAAGIEVAAARAAATAQRCREQWRLAQSSAEAAWTAFEEADEQAQRAAAAGVYPLVSRRRKAGENAERRRYLHQAATSACRRRELSIGQLNEVLAHRGWNPRLHPVQQQAALAAAVREHRFTTYRRAIDRERRAWAASERAASALAALRTEATTARLRPAAAPTVTAEPDAVTQTLPLPSTVDGRHPIAA